MKVLEFLSYLNSLDIKIWLEEDKLRYQSPKGAMTTEIKQEIGTRKPEILAFLKQAKMPSSSADLAIVPVSRDEDLPLSFAQQRLWFLHQLSPDSHSYNMLEALRLGGSLNIVALEQSLSELVRRHEVLRTTFPTVDGNPIQRIAPATALTLPIHDLQGLSAQEQTAQIRQIGKSVASKPFDLAVGPLIEFTLLQLDRQEYVLLLKMHHIIYDGWSLSIFFGELSQLYAAFTQGLPNPLPELPIQYADFAFWQRQWLSGSVLESQLNYWEQQLAGAPGVLELATDKPRPPMQSFRGAAEFFLLDRDLTQRLKQLSQQSETTLFMTLLAAFLVLLSRHSGQSDILVGSPIANRNSKSVEQLMGFFANTLALRGDLSGNPSFAEFLAQVRQTTLSAYAHQDLPFEMLVEKLQPERDLSRNPLVQVVFSLQNAPQSASNLSGLNIQNIALPIDIKARFDLEVNFWETPGGLEGSWCYNTDLFDATTITRIAQHFETLLQAIVANPKARVFELPLLSPAERHQLLVEWNDTQVDYPHDLCIHQLFEEQVERTPDAVAVVFEDEQLTYHQLNCRANQLAHYLRSLGVGADVLVGLCVERSVEMVVGILGILKAGGAYVPLDPAYPQTRLAFMVEDVKTSILLTQSHLQDTLPSNLTQTVIALDSNWQMIAEHKQHNLSSQVNPENLAQIIYTSGSTGTPKGTEVLHRSIIGFTFGAKDVINFNREQIFLQYSSMSWDALTLELWPPLLNGGCCVLYPGKIPTPEKLSQTIQKHQVNILWLTSALFNLMIDTMPQGLLGIKQLMIGGEAVSLTHVRRALELLPGTQIINGYGPSECTVFTCCYQIPQQLQTNIESIPIGRPIANTQVYILDKNLQPVPVGVPGELHIGGAGLARGYLNRPELTNQKFIPNPFEVEESRLYKTGDLVRYLPDGNIQYLGRIDNQVKIRGFRIELGEIEAVISQYDDVQVSCVIVHEDTPGEKRLVAYVVPQKGVIFTTEELRQFLTDKMPLYMVPSAFVILESLPLTPNGKVDHRALRAISNTDNFKKFVQPRNQLELQLVQIWSKVLKVNKVGVQDNFFDLGGHSLLAAYLMAQIQEQFGKNLPLTTLFQNPTIEQLATIVQKDSDYSDSSCLVPIQPKGSNSPFFCVPGAPGSPYYFYHLGRYLGVDQPLYGFENNLYELRLFSRLEDIASHYIQAMQAVQPQGPYFLGGHSYGGNVVFEMAQQLVAQGHEVALLAVIDASPSTYKDKQLLADYVDWDDVRWLAEVSKGIKLYLDKNIDVSYDILQNLTMEEQLKYVLDYFKMANMLPPNAQITQLQNLVQAYKSSCLCLVNYQSNQIYPGKITIVRANEDLPDDPNSHLIAEDSQDLSLGWSEFCSEVDIQFVLGNHITIMAEPHVQVLAERLKACIEQAQS
ncbi:MAG: amino acid adenylation domain-containing protein [Nostoc sp. EkiNYC01]|nr:amino acid adenylation domain-containing protein [Nostoc sp. EkiNYC01]